MKKILFILCCMLLSLCLIACDEKDIFNGYGENDNQGDTVVGEVTASKVSSDVWSANIDVSGINVVNASQKDENGNSNYTFSILGVNDTPILVTLVKGVEKNISCFLSDTNTGKNITKIYAVAANGVKKAVTDITDFAIDKGIIALQIEIEDAINVEKIELSTNSYDGYYLNNKYKFKLDTHVYPENATNQYVKYYTSNSNVAKVNNKGVVTIVGKGSATITAISLDGACSDKCYILIKDGTEVLRDSSEKMELTESQYREGNRYDAMDTTINGIYSCGAESLVTGKLAVGGTFSYSDSKTYGTIQYGEFDGNKFGIEKQLDSTDKFYSERFLDITYSSDNKCFFAIQSVKKTKDSSSEYLYGYIYSEVKNKEGKDTLTQSRELEINVSNYQLEKITAASIASYNTHYLVAITFSSNTGNKSYIIELDENLNIISENTKLYTSITEFKNIKYYPEEKVILAVGNTGNVNTVLYKNGTYEDFAYSKYYDKAQITGIDLINEDTFVACCNAISPTTGANVSYVEKFEIIEGKVDSIGKISINNDDILDLELIEVFYHGGVISVIGNGRGYRLEKTGFLNIKKVEVEYYYSIVINIDPDRMVDANGYRYFNGKGEGGNKQFFATGLITSKGQLIGIGYSNYKNESFNNGYIQFNIQWM